MIIKVEKLFVLDYKWFNFDKKIMLVLVCSQKENPIWVPFDGSNETHMQRYIWLKGVWCELLPVRFGRKKNRKSKKIRCAYKMEILSFDTYSHTKWSKLPDEKELKDIALVELYDMLNGKGVE